MRTAAALFLLLTALIWCAARVEVDGPPEAPSALHTPWRRAQSGWERADTWRAAASLSRCEASAVAELPHPAIMALMELLAASLFLTVGHRLSREK